MMWIYRKRLLVRYLLVVLRSITAGLYTILPPNSTDQTRRAYILVFSGPPQKLDNPIERPWQTEEQEALAKLKSLAADRE